MRQRAFALMVGAFVLVTAGAAPRVSAQAGGTARTVPGAPRALPAEIDRSAGASALQGAWTIQSVTSPQPPVNPRRNPKGLIVISGNHYAQVGVGDTMRPSLPEGGAAKATADQLRAVWGPVIADAGTFTVSGNTIKLTALVAKGTAGMASGNFVEMTFTISGDNLTVTQVRNNVGPIANPVTVRATRAN